jgi:hypothetical protein
VERSRKRVRKRSLKGVGKELERSRKRVRKRSWKGVGIGSVKGKGKMFKDEEKTGKWGKKEGRKGIRKNWGQRKKTV